MTPQSVSRTCLVGLAGRSCSGKSSIAARLAELLPGEALVLPLDHYYHDLGAMAFEERFRFNFDVPEAIDHGLLLSNLRDLARGASAVRPVYLFPEHVRSPEGQRVGPVDWVIAEGLFALLWDEVRALLDLAVYLDAPDDLCLERRIERDVRERGRTPESVVTQYTDTVRPMYEIHVAPTRKHADLVLDGQRPLAESARVICDRLQIAG